MKIGILGAGSLGSVFGGVLAEGGHEVTLFTRSEEYREAVDAGQLFFTEDPGGKSGRRIRVRTAGDVGQLSGSELLLVMVKSTATREVAKKAVQAGVIGPETVVLTLQNGLGNEEILGEIVGADRVIAGRTYVSGRLLGPGRVMAAVKGCRTIIGELDGRVTERIRRIGREFGRVGLTTEISSDIRGVIWDKLLVNVATGAVSGITGLDYGRMYEKYGKGALPELKAVACAAVAEAIAVAGTYGIRLSIHDPELAWDLAAKDQPETFRTSLLQSLERGQKTEIDVINGAVVRWGQEAGVPTPVNDTLSALVRGIEFRLGAEGEGEKMAR